MTRRAVLFLAFFVAAEFPMAAQAYEPTAVTPDGRVMRTSEQKPGPWHADVVKQEFGDYPYLARSRHREGIGWFRLQLRPDGSVGEVKVMQSTGDDILDRSALAAFHRWRFKAGKWKSVDEPMFFTLQRPR
jgi:protein TonB